MDLKETAARHLERIQPDAIALSHRIHANPELGFAEHEASRLVTEALSGAGFSVAQVAIGLLRQHISPASRIHGITRGGEAPNVVPGETEGRFYVRSQTLEDQAELRRRVELCFQAGAIAAGCELSISLESPCAEPTGDRAVLDGALAMAWTVIDIATSQDQRRRLLSPA
jgi:metal-dependent amidase/aminoacylase/carboxypeptidase family protein